eukprot:2502622-Rhodomonas_salina.1
MSTSCSVSHMLCSASQYACPHTHTHTSPLFSTHSLSHTSRRGGGSVCRCAAAQQQAVTPHSGFVTTNKGQPHQRYSKRTRKRQEEGGSGDVFVALDFAEAGVGVVEEEEELLELGEPCLER